MEKDKYILGLDIGISSVGWALLKINEDNKPIKIKDLGVKIFSPGEVVKTGESKNLDRRNKRLSRRIIRRKEFRLNRVKLLLSKYNYIEKSQKKVLSEIFDDLKIKYNNMLNNYYKNKNVNPFILRTEGLNRKLTNEELSIILVHYAKNRGYKSNREEDNEEENGKIKEAISNNKKLMKEHNYLTISQMFTNDPSFKDKIHNTTNDYKMSVSRELVLDDIKMVLDAQLNFGLINNDFINEYLNIWSSQRHYSKGPGGDSKYGGDLIKKMTGVCKFDANPRAPKQAPSSEIYVALTKLVNLRYRTVDDLNYKSLNENQINKIIDEAYEKDHVTYKSISKIIGVENIVIKDLSLTVREYGKLCDKFKLKVLKNDSKEKIIFSELSEKQLSDFNKLKNDEILSKNLISLNTYSMFRKCISNAFGSDIWKKEKHNLIMLDEIAVILTNYKTNEDIEKEIRSNDIIDNIYIDMIINDFKTLKDHLSLSLELIRDLIPLMKKGMIYSEAMEELGYNHSDTNDSTEKCDLLLPINYEGELNNQRVIRSLSQTRKLINSIIKRYGMPYKINIETARELAKEMSERNKIKKFQDENKENNNIIKKKLADLLPNTFKNEEKVSGQDILKYKLWEEQNNTCTYSLEKISIEELFDNNIIQIDHILPYSRTFDDSKNNKTLVKAKYNQEKGNKTPYEWMKNTEKWEEFKKFINSLDISDKKRDNYLLLSLTPEKENEYREQNLNDTKYITKYLTAFLKAHLNVPIVDNVNGIITGKLRSRWGLNYLTHSLQSKSYYIKDVDEDSMVKKNRDNHLHHAMDACVIACANPSLIQKITKYEKYKKYFENKTDSQLKDILNTNNILIHDESKKFIDEETGEVIDDGTIEEFIKDIKNNKYIIKIHKNISKLEFPLPYPNFVNELKYRVFERDKKSLEFCLKGLNSYSDTEIKDIYPIIPVQTKEKIKGALHKDTFYGIKETENIKYITTRISVISSSFNIKKLEQISDKGNGSKEVYNTLLNWLGDSKNGEEAYKLKGIPLDKTGKQIKKIKIENIYEGKGHVIKGKLAEKTSILRIEVFQEKENMKLLFAGLDYNDIISLRKDENTPIILWSAQGKSDIYPFTVCSNNYNHYITLYKNDLILLEKDDGTSGICYVNGCSSGIFEISSPLGDSYDLTQCKLFDNFRERYTVTVSTIKSIKKIKINTLGKIENGL